MVSMPSQVVDVAWHEFILYTRPYEKFCKKGLGRFLHHTPTEAMSSPTVAQDGIKRAWRLSCARHKIDPARPAELPLLFSIDKQLNIEDGFIYSKNCSLVFIVAGATTIVPLILVVHLDAPAVRGDVVGSSVAPVTLMEEADAVVVISF